MTRTTVGDRRPGARFDNVALLHVRKDQDPEAVRSACPTRRFAGADGATGINSCVTDLAKLGCDVDE